jgi:hypothetical protein
MRVPHISRLFREIWETQLPRPQALHYSFYLSEKSC